MRIAHPNGVAFPRLRQPGRVATLWAVLLLGLLAYGLAAAAGPADPVPDAGALRAQVQAMKADPKGPFVRIRWFCADGSVLPPTPFACKERGGGRQHGEWSDTTRALRAAGYPIATVFAAIESGDVLAPGSDPELLPSILLERFLIATDDGWILRRARYYRGAFQTEGEAAGARRLLEALLAEPVWQTQRFLLLRESARLFPIGRQEVPLTEARALATVIGEQDPGFLDLRNKIHAQPEAGDARTVMRYAEKAPASLRDSLERLSELLARAFAPPPLTPVLSSLSNRAPAPELAGALRDLATPLPARREPVSRLAAAARGLVLLRDELASFGRARIMVEALEASLALEQEAYVAARLLLGELPESSRRARLDWLGELARIAYGMGLLTTRELHAAEASLARLAMPVVDLTAYRDELNYLARLPAWAQARLGFFFGPAVQRFTVLDPLAANFVPDRLRASPLLSYVAILDSLLVDAYQLSGVQHRLFERQVGAGMRALNPGLARGPLYAELPDADALAGQPRGIVLVPETVPELPPVAGILTEAEGNALSHVQLLARNQGIPNVVVGEALLPEIRARAGETAVLAVSPAGVVNLLQDDPGWNAYFARQGPPEAQIRVDLEKLHLTTRRPIALAELRARDSGQVVGPKAAQLGELAHRFPGKVSPALAIPFGRFRQLLEQPGPGDDVSLFAWMQAQYRELEAIPDAREQEFARRTLLARLRERLASSELDADSLRELHTAMQSFGPDGSYGVFVRSDTNVEDLPGFTGAGLNLTVPHVVGFDNIVAAIKQVWASPFTERAFAWRQDLMDRPEHVYVSVLLHRSVPSEKSGVLITADLDTGARDVITVVVNEGVGGGVEGQAAESFKLSLATGELRLLSSAAASHRRELRPEGGLRTVRASAPERLLTEEELAQLAALARALPESYPDLRDEEGAPAVADIEFGFVDGQLVLFQIRPFVSSRAAMRNAYLQGLDEPLAASAGIRVDLRGTPGE